ncbi:MAG: outer membrane beta-barrel protein [Alteraurantiacibacter sp.]
MRLKIATLAAVAAIAIAAPAQAEELRLEARGGMFFQGGSEEATAGGAIGFDGELAPGVFGGVELSADKILQGGTDVVFGFSGRVGTNVGEATKLYATGGYVTAPCDTFCATAWSLGAGAQQSLGGPLYAKAEYRHFFSSNGFADGDTVLVGLGVQF